MEPKVSIIIPAYNAEAYVKEAVDSALAQTYKNREVIVVDDGSTDGTKKVLEPYIARKEIIYILQSNKGLAGARNTGTRAAKGEYIALLDSDDIFLPEKVAEQVAALESRPDFAVCYCGLIHFTDPPAGRAGSEPKRFYHHRFYYPSGDIFEPLLRRQFVNPLSVLARREVFEKYGYFDEALRRSEDWDLWLRWAHAGVKFYYLDKILAEYRMRSVGNLSAVESEPAMKDKSLELFTRFGKTLKNEEWQKYGYGKILDNLRIKAAFAYLMVGDKKTASARLPESSAIWRITIAILPAGAWRRLLVFLRQVKHRLLLKKV
jgi:glycosyltransferase involved in cell wall biosynthesis